MEGKRTFKELQNEMSFLDLNEFAKKVTESYANSVTEYSQDNVSRDNKISKKALREIMDYAIVTNLVSMETAIKVLEKSIVNQKAKESSAGSSSIIHHKKLLKQRNELLAYSFSDDFVRMLAIEVANSRESLAYFKMKYRIESEKLLKYLLQRAIVENIVSDEVMEKIIERSLKVKKDSKSEEYFQILRMQRIRNSQ